MRRLAVVLLVLGACHGRAGNAPPCGTVAGRFFMLARDEASKATLDPETRRALGDQLPAMRDALAKACSDGGWSADVRACMVGADSHLALQACEQQLTDAQRRALDHAARGEESP
jgi:hypothetical protein